MATGLNAALDAARDAIASDVAELAVGDSNAAEDPSQTGLQGTEVIDKTESGGGLTESTPSTGVVRYECTIGLSEANGSTFEEYVLRVAANDARTRSTYPSFTKQNDFEVRFTVEVRVTNA